VFKEGDVDVTHPLEAILYCPRCSKQHVDEGAFATRLHYIHACVDGPDGKGCGYEWHISRLTFGREDSLIEILSSWNLDHGVAERIGPWKKHVRKSKRWKF